MLQPQTAVTTIVEAETTAREFYGLEPVELLHLSGGRVHDTFKLTCTTGLFILQRLNDLFNGHQALGENWDTVHQALQQRSGHSPGPMPPIFPDCSGRYLSPGPPGSGGHWRLTGYMDGTAPARTAASAREAARLLGFCHLHLNLPTPLEFLPLPEGEFTNCRLTQASDFSGLAELYRGHPLLEEIKPTLELATEATCQLPRHPAFTQIFYRKDMIIHCDPKADNFLFDQQGQAKALLDWDTVQPGDILVDIAEMLRSWGTPPKAEPQALNQALREPLPDTLSPVLEGYAETGLPLTTTEIALLPPVVRALCLNLCRRYLNDAFTQIYFQWDCQTYPSLYHQNMARAMSLLNQAENILTLEPELTRAFQEAYNQGKNHRNAT